MKKNTTHIRTKPEDADRWKKYCKMTGESSPKLFSKVMQSDQIRLKERILQETRKRREEQDKWIRRA